MGTFGQKLKQLRIEKNVSQAKLAEYVGVSRIAITWWEQDKKVPTLYYAAAVAKYFGVTLDYLAGLEDD